MARPLGLVRSMSWCGSCALLVSKHGRAELSAAYFEYAKIRKADSVGERKSAASSVILNSHCVADVLLKLHTK